MDKKERLEKLLEFIKTNDMEYDFDKLLAKLDEEYNIERAIDSDRATNGYLNNLHITREKQADEYKTIKARRPKQGAPVEFRSFCSHFRDDVEDALRNL